MSNQTPEWSDGPGNDGLERMFAAEEAAIRDEGFSSRVTDQAHDNIGWRRTILYGAGMAGFGAAVAGIMEIAPHLPKLTGWWSGVSRVLQAGAGATPDPTSPMVLIIAAVAAGVSFLALAVATQER